MGLMSFERGQKILHPMSNLIPQGLQRTDVALLVLDLVGQHSSLHMDLSEVEMVVLPQSSCHVGQTRVKPLNPFLSTGKLIPGFEGIQTDL